jgi:hypothetical protein
MAAVSSNDPQKMRGEAAKLRAEGYTDSANSLDAYAASVETNAAVVQGALQNVGNVLSQALPTTPKAAPMPTVPEPPPVQLPPAAAPLPTAPPTTDIQLPGMSGPIQIPANIMQQAQDVFPTLISTMTGAPASSVPTPVVTTGSPAWPGLSDPSKMAVATAMNLNLASTSKGKENKNLVKQFQKQEGGAAGATDGLYGPKVAMRLGSEYGIIPPTPLYWSSKTPVANQKGDYAIWLSEMADQDPVRLEQWLAAAAAATR